MLQGDSNLVSFLSLYGAQLEGNQISFNLWRQFIEEELISTNKFWKNIKKISVKKQKLFQMVCYSPICCHLIPMSGWPKRKSGA